MRFSFPTSYCGKVQSLGLLPGIKPAGRIPRCVRMDSTTRRYRRKEKIIVIMGATGTGKSRLSIDLATRFPSEIINSDKIQVYKGLDITTNKIPMHDRLGIPHHLLGKFDSSEGELTPFEYRSHAAAAVSDISARRRLPLIVGGSNSFIYALVAERLDPDSDSDAFDLLHSLSSESGYNCCFLWIDVSLPLLCEYLSRRVDDMIDTGMVDELAEFYKHETESDSAGDRVGLRKAIGIPEFERYFRSFPPGGVSGVVDTMGRWMLFEEAVDAIKDNTCQLAKRQVGKILRLRSAGWDLRRLDATEAFRAVVASDSGMSSKFWEDEVVEPSVKIVRRFLEE